MAKRGMYIYRTGQKLAPSPAAVVSEMHSCPECDGRMYRTYERHRRAAQYIWQPFGWRCATCNAIVMELGS